MTGCSAAAAQYAPPGWLAQHPCDAGSALPMTGLSLGLLLAVAAILLVLGVALHERAHTNVDPIRWPADGEM